MAGRPKGQKNRRRWTCLCVVCGEQYVSTRSDSVCCTPKCRKRAERIAKSLTHDAVILTRCRDCGIRSVWETEGQCPVCGSKGKPRKPRGDSPESPSV